MKVLRACHFYSLPNTIFFHLFTEGVSWQIYSQGDGGMQLMLSHSCAHQDRAFLNIYPPGLTHWFQFKNILEIGGGFVKMTERR